MKKNRPQKTTRRHSPAKTRIEGLLPSVRNEIRFLLNSEEAKISTRGIITGAVTLFSLGIATDAMAANHVNEHDNFAPHASIAPHHSVDCGHDNVAVHQSVNPHVSVAPHNDIVAPHTNSHANINEAVTKGTFHNNVADGYGKHSANVGHNNNPNIHTNASGHTNTAPHYNYGAHASAAPHVNVGHHASGNPHHNVTVHHSGHHSTGQPG